MKDFAISENPAVQAQLDRLAALPLPRGGLGLDTIRTLLQRLGDPQRRLPPVFHVAGTNGKGSTCAFLRAMLEAEGHRVNVGTKPHLVRYNERIRLAGELISDALLAEPLEEALDNAGDLPASFFEITTAAMFLAFARTPADACVIEVGLGGRFDATNVIERPAACGIAALGLDHEAFLLADDPDAPSPENALVRIAFEKAGIARPGAPLVTQNYDPEVEDELIRRAGLAKSPLKMRGAQWTARAGLDSIAYEDRHGPLDLPLPAMAGAYQADNAALAVAMLRHQDAVPVGAASLAEGIRSAYWPARLHHLSAGPLTELLPDHDWLLDGGHNLLAAEAVARYFGRTMKDRPRFAIIGMLQDKDWRGYIDTLAPHLDALVAVPVDGHAHAPPGQLAQRAAEAGVGATGTAADLEGAARWIGERMTRPGEVFIGGSLYLAGKVLSANLEFPD
ncbi:bifunctional folylpolyglutamate synthase/dihydrofolate synthase [Aurantiacibacter aquimixticola]|uniref:Bifunctional folylpolyglutamate synthase/dihydrofolate synthase n=1 Tax=Aurantiacibacter aquimixticola TaxID=1958945 RepID=A0A419RST2_9SPHN|nr:folylpolyglutamate synthase/dihydrofolate synthase family protein [Aurantiacibacter aquimixticola]RJY08835.1 bifunctional folylpolyglutamate synthase/dihydrofolate synthase [Aurantiacibacter aquimixticola]